MFGGHWGAGGLSDKRRSREHLQTAIEILKPEFKDKAVAKLLEELGLNLVDKGDEDGGHSRT